MSPKNRAKTLVRLKMSLHSVFALFFVSRIGGWDWRWTSTAFSPDCWSLGMWLFDSTIRGEALWSNCFFLGMPQKSTMSGVTGWQPHLACLCSFCTTMGVGTSAEHAHSPAQLASLAWPQDSLQGWFSYTCWLGIEASPWHKPQPALALGRCLFAVGGRPSKVPLLSPSCSQWVVVKIGPNIPRRQCAQWQMNECKILDGHPMLARCQQINFSKRWQAAVHWRLWARKPNSSEPKKKTPIRATKILFQSDLSVKKWWSWCSPKYTKAWWQPKKNEIKG